MWLGRWLNLGLPLPDKDKAEAIYTVEMLVILVDKEGRKGEG
jgi:hypothetical protein